MSPQAPRRRVLLKLSGEAFGAGKMGVDPEVLTSISKEIAAAARDVEVAIVVGGGNFFRGAQLANAGMDRARADYMGMLGTVMNALALQDFIEQAGTPARVQSAIEMRQVAEPYIPLRSKRHMEKGRVVIFGAGAGLRTSRPTPSQLSARWKSAQTWCSSPRMASTASTQPTHGATRARSCSTRSPTRTRFSAASRSSTRPRSASAWTTAWTCVCSE